ncbi:glycosyl hydrolase family 28-related protein [Myroides odoratimimus]|uniref:glycosyl hydrolase family 28-related protein n=1 Tax=Myroides odoratimimus TaxID=76832 RepID=UPI0025781191|nr:glycosyl hydrolase family 28-related protein [Myroides odoratimimus]MDM1086230.1 hypothetical protein [Myroides odoratimimus]
MYKFFIFLLFSTTCFSKDINLSDRGIVGDGVFDNWMIIQKAIDEVIESGGGVVNFPKGEFAIYNKSLVIWGNNVKLIGIDYINSSIVKKGRPGYFGDCLDITGQIKGYQYFGDFGKGNYNKRKVYEGETIKVKNIVIENLGFISDLDKSVDISRANNIGILNAENIKIINCKVQAAPQTNVGIVNDTSVSSTHNIIFENCIFLDSGQHNVRVISYNQGNKIGNKVKFLNCQFLNVLNIDIVQKELKGYKVHLWYRGLGSILENEVVVENCYFDETGFIYVNGNQNNISIKKSLVDSFLFVQNSSLDSNSLINVNQSTFMKKGDFESLLQAKKRFNSVRGSKIFEESSFGIMYPSILEYKK